MGAALIRAFAGSGRDVTVWNRTHERALGLAAPHVEPVRSIGEAVAMSPLVLACLSTYDDVRASLDEIDLAGRALVNLTSGTPRGAEEMADWAAARDVDYLDGAILAFPDFIGSPDALLAYSGSRRVGDTHGALLRRLGGQSQWIGERADVANICDASVIASFYTTAITAYVEAATFALDNDVPPDVLRAATRVVLRTLGHSTKEAAAAIATGDYSTDQAKLSTYAIGTRDVLQSVRRSGVPARLLGATVESLDAACAAGHGDEGICAVAEVVRAQPDG
jgi:3-hydroxyisobutyrate dehydrogenase-like beta-hydroxyacid dehydrogenase